MTTRRAFTAYLLSGAAVGLSACAGAPPEEPAAPEIQYDPGYGPLFDGEYTLPPVPAEYTQGVNKRMLIPYNGSESDGSVEVDIYAKFLYLVLPDGMAMRYPIAVGRLGRALRFDTTIRDKRQWPSWTPTANMLRSEPEVYGPFAGGVPGGLASPLGARALYLYRNGRDTRYRIHGTNDMRSIGNSGSAGCIRLFNHDAIDLYERVSIPTPVKMRSESESMRLEPEYFGRGVELPPTIVDPETIYGASDDGAEVAASEPATSDPLSSDTL